MDAIDSKIITLLQKNARLSIVDISKEVCLSRPSVKERINKLVEQKIIQEFTIMVDQEKMGKPISYFIEVSQLMIPTKKFETILTTFPDIIEIHTITGTANYIVKGASKSTNEMNVLLSELIKYAKVNTSLILNSTYSIA
ncbi:Lrp/AsnC family transcriptional regulator [Isobaculum melis]|uniref:Lrp/AsnC family transcriptional regulator, leucine-responsive regulatory protein n=1 Tax=Isobaculum melis TaxID=142588 RepID=A0A1H9UAE3_9LACT|nr:Lrp/AsnC family transcriptional regulator [Isobaculum melis]SES06435.1 Lrp/AsnC family transcriptional regulator, leucine-responsive regulatory protein [Isobaculum melis]